MMGTHGLKVTVVPTTLHSALLQLRELRFLPRRPIAKPLSVNVIIEALSSVPSPSYSYFLAYFFSPKVLLMFAPIVDYNHENGSKPDLQFLPRRTIIPKWEVATEIRLNWQDGYSPTLNPKPNNWWCNKWANKWVMVQQKHCCKKNSEKRKPLMQ